MTALIILIKFVGALISAAVAFGGLWVVWMRIKTWRMKLKIAENTYASTFISHFNDTEIRQALTGYVRPFSSPFDPSNREGTDFLANTREPLFDYFDRAIRNSPRFYHLLLADTGMGKTTFCLNYYSHLTTKFPEFYVALVSLSREDALTTIKEVGQKSKTILLADALDEVT